jgi:hypothetical protein
VAKKKVVAAAASVSSIEAFPTAGLTLQLEVPTAAASSIPSQKVGEECYNSGLDGQLEVVVAIIQLEATVAGTSKAARLRETFPMALQVVGPYKNPVT